MAVHLFQKQLHWVAAALAVLTSGLLMPHGASAVVIDTSTGAGNTTAPSFDPGWSNVGIAGAGSAVYLGDRWVITAAHVGIQPVTLNGVTYQPEAGTAVQLNNPAGSNLSTFADLGMYRLTTDPHLPSLTISSSTPALASTVVMIGAGRDRAASEIGWQVTTTTTGSTWNPVPLPIATQYGFNLLGTREMRWGQSLVSTSADLASHTATGDLIVGAANFSSSQTLPYSAQAVTGDSGGAVFSYIQGHWQLSGIMDSMQSTAAQPSNTAVFGDQTLFADLSRYATQINQLLVSADANRPWQNPVDRFDVDNNGAVTTSDAMLIINELKKNGSHALTLNPLAPNAPPPYYDVSGDNSVTTSDAMLILNDLKAHPAALQFADQVMITPVPEPETKLLAGLGVLVLAMWQAAVRRPLRKPNLPTAASG